MRMELEELEREEMEHLGNGRGAVQQANGSSNGNGAHQDGQEPPQPLNGDAQPQINGHANAKANGTANGHADNVEKESDSGNVQRADEAFDSQHQAPSERHSSVDADAPLQSSSSSSSSNNLLPTLLLKKTLTPILPMAMVFPAAHLLNLVISLPTLPHLALPFTLLLPPPEPALMKLNSFSAPL